MYLEQYGGYSSSLKSLLKNPVVRLFLCLFNSLLMSRAFIAHLLMKIINWTKHAKKKSCSLLLLEGVMLLRRKFVAWPAAQLNILKSVLTLFLQMSLILDFLLDSSNTDGNILCGICWLQNYVSCKHHLLQ